jgi:hypothetical protein
VVHLLLVLASTQLFTPSATATLGAHPFLEAVMQVCSREILHEVRLRHRVPSYYERRGWLGAKPMALT